MKPKGNFRPSRCVRTPGGFRRRCRPSIITPGPTDRAVDPPEPSRTTTPGAADARVHER